MDAVLSWIKKVAAEANFSKGTKIYLFGSRARGDHRPRSDYDIAIETPDHERVSKFVLDVQDNIPTLSGVDVVLLHEADPEMVQQVQQEGRVIYAV